MQWAGPAGDIHCFTRETLFFSGLTLPRHDCVCRMERKIELTPGPTSVPRALAVAQHA